MATVHHGCGALAHPSPHIDLRDSNVPPYSPPGDAVVGCAEEDGDGPAYDGSSSTSAGPSNSPTGGPHIPIKLWKRVFQFVRVHSQHHAAQMPLLCKDLRADAESVLYQGPHLTSWRTALMFADTVSAAPRLALSVRTISFTQWPDDQAPLSQDRFYLRPPTIDRPPDTHRCRMVGMGLEKLRGLTSIVVRNGASMRTIAALFDETNVRLVRITGDHLVLDQPTVAFLKTQHQLKELRLYHRDAEDFEKLGLRRIHILSCSYRFLFGLSSSHRLTHLNVTSVMSADDIAGIIRMVGPRLARLRLEQNVRKQQGRLYPTNGHAWDRCPCLRFLHVRHVQPHANAMTYLSNESVDACNLPPALKTLVWSPAWTRARTHHLYPDERKRAEIRQFTEAVLRSSATLTSVIYEWAEESFFKCFLLESGEWREIPTTAAEAAEDAWADIVRRGG